MRRIIICFIAVTSFLLSVTAHAQDFSAMKDMGSAKVIEVITPYNVQLNNGQIIHLSGLHYPDYSAQNAGEASLLAMKVLKDLLGGQEVRIFQTPKKDWGRQNRMGHQIAHLQRSSDGLWVQGLMFSLGLAQVKTTQRAPEMAAQMYPLESEARDERLGIWAGESAILSPEGAAAHLNGFHIVEGKIESVAMNKNRLYINFGKNWRDDFTVSIPPAALKSFTAEGLDFLQWGGRNLRVRGWVEEYNGPHIEINHPQAVEIIDSNP